MSDLLDDILPVEPPRARAPVVMISLTPDDEAALDQLRVLMKLPTWPDVLVELIRRARPSPNGTAYEVACFGCGEKFTVKRRPIPGRHSWCDTCKASGEPAAQRARDYRERKATQTS